MQLSDAEFCKGLENNTVYLIGFKNTNVNIENLYEFVAAVNQHLKDRRIILIPLTMMEKGDIIVYEPLKLDKEKLVDMLLQGDDNAHKKS